MGKTGHREPAPLKSAVFLSIFVALVPSRAAAQGNYHSAPYGGRSALLGGTGVATGVDGAAPFLNPASIVRIADRRIAFSARFFRLSHRSLTDLHQPGPVDPAFGPLQLPDANVSTTSLRSVPDTTCYFFSRSGGEGAKLTGRSKLALCLAKTEESEFEITALNYKSESAGRRVDQSQSFRDSWGTWSFGPTFAIYVRDDLAIGASVNLTRSRHQSSASVASLSEDLGTGAIVSSAYQSADYGSSWDGLMHLGITYRLSERVTLGASLRTPSLHFAGSYSASEDARFDTTFPGLSHWGGDGTFRVRSPMRLNLGMGAEYERFRFETNLFLHSGVDEFAHAELDRDQVRASNGQVTARSNTSLVRNESVKPVVNAGIGAEYFVSKNLSLLTGLSSDFSALRALSTTASDNRLFHQRMNAWHASIGISSYTDFGDLVFGMRGDYLSGKVNAINGFSEPVERDLISAREWALMLILAGRISLNTVAKAAEDVGKVVTGDAVAPGNAIRKPLQPPKRD